MTFPTMLLGDVCQTFTGGTPSRTKPQYFGGGIPWVKITDMLQGTILATDESLSDDGIANSSAKVLPVGTVLISIFATIGRTAVLGIEAATNQAIAGVVPKDTQQLQSDYLRYFLDSKHSELNRVARGVAQPNINQGILKGLEIPIPPLPEQRRIVDLLSRAEGIVRLRREAEKKAAELIPALFLDMFGDPATNPKGWAVVALGDIVEEFRYGTSQKSGPTGLPVLRIPNVVGDRLQPADMKFVSIPEGEANRLRLQDGDMLFVRTNGNPDYVGRSAVFDSCVMKSAGFDGENSLYASYLIRARVKCETIDPSFLQTYLSSIEGRRKLKERCRTSAGQFNINIDGLSSIPVPVPDKALQIQFAERSRNVSDLLNQQSAATAKAQATFEALLAQVFS